MSTRKLKSRNKTNITPRNRPRSSGVATLSALWNPSYHPSQNKELAKKLAEKERDLQQRTENNSLINENNSLIKELMKDPEYRGIVNTWKNIEGDDDKPQNRGSPGTPNRTPNRTPKKTLKRSLTIPIGLNNLKGGRKRKGTKKKRRNKTKKRGNKKNQRK
jgi:hypothetical protein